MAIPRKKCAANQSPKESIEQGKASCTGLSIVLADACRAVCVPARLVGTPLWANKRGNHTWVEIWDKTWHFTGACEPDPKGLDRGWFVGDAAQAKKDVAEHAIYAASFKKTQQHFPLVWARRNKSVPAENVTDHYAKSAGTKPDTGRSAEAIKALRTAVEAGPEAVAELVRGDIAKMPLTKADAATARELLWKAHVAPVPEGSRRRSEGTRPQGRQTGNALLLQDLRPEACQGLESVDIACTAAVDAQGRQRSAMGEPEEALHAR